MAWGPVDTKLSVGLTLLEEEICKECGIPSWIGHSTDNRIVFKSDKAHCFGCMELEKNRADESKAKKAADHGAKPYVRPELWDGSMNLPSRREEYERRRN